MAEENTKVVLPEISEEQQQQLQQGMSPRQVFYPAAEAVQPPVEPQEPQAEQNKEEEAAYAKRLNAGELTGKTADGYKAGAFYTDFFEKNNPYKKRVEDAEEQLERMRRNKLFATIGSGFDAFHQAYANMRGVKPMESAKVGEKYLAQYKDLKKYRDANQDAYTKAYIEAKRHDTADKLNADMMKFREKQLEETQKYRDAMLGYKKENDEQNRQLKREINDTDNATKKDIADANLASQEKRAAEKNATSMHNTNIRYQNGRGSGGKKDNDEYKKETNETYTTVDEFGNKKITNKQKTEIKQKKDSGSGLQALPKASNGLHPLPNNQKKK